MSLKNWLKKAKAKLRAWTASTTKPPSAEPLPLPSPQTGSAGSSSNNTANAPDASANAAATSSDFDGIEKYNGKSRGTWSVTVTISNVRVTGDVIRWDEAKGQREARGWNVVGSGKRANGEVNLIVPSVKAAGCFDFLGVGQTVKTTGNLIFKSVSEAGMFAPWNPKKGDRVGFYICSLNRVASQHKVSERSNVVWFTWP